jgi:DNA-binding CsgD family transcriptional regulator
MNDPDHLIGSGTATMGRAQPVDHMPRGRGVAASELDSLHRAAAAAFARGRSSEAHRLLGVVGVVSPSDHPSTVALVLLSTFAGHASARRHGPGAFGDVARKLVGWGQPLTAFSVLVAAEPDAGVREVARSLALSRPSDCGLAAVVALHEGNFSLALQLLTEAGHQADGAELHGVRTHIRTLVGDLSVRLGSQVAARQSLVGAIELSTRTGQPSWAARALVAEATRCVLSEDPHRDQLVKQAHRLALTAAPDLCDRAELLEATALAADDRWTDAFDVLHRLARRGPREVTHLLSSGLLSLLADAAAHSGREIEARTLISRIAAVDTHCERDIELAELLYATAVLSDDATAETCFEVALSLNPYRLPWHRARTSLAYGGWLRRARRVTESRSHLLEAHRIFEALDLPAWVRRAQGELRASGMRTGDEPARTARPLDLSPQELEIAHLVARGLTNRQIGEALHLSPRTIGSHLYRIFPKLDVTSRNQLATLLR